MRFYATRAFFVVICGLALCFIPLRDVATRAIGAGPIKHPTAIQGTQAGPPGAAAGAPAAKPATGGARPSPPENARGAVRDAIQALKLAEVRLKAAPHDFGGHRTDALKAADAAIKELSLVLKYDSD